MDLVRPNVFIYLDVKYEFGGNMSNLGRGGGEEGQARPTDGHAEEQQNEEPRELTTDDLSMYTTHITDEDLLS